MMDVLAAYAWTTNAAMIADVARLGYLDGQVLDATYGDGNFWTDWKPETLITNDLHKPADLKEDYRAFSFDDSTVDAVVFDPPYRLSGRRDQGQFDQAYGLCEYRGNDEITADLCAGAVECFRVARKFLLIKCMDQVNGGRVRWQTDFLTEAIVRKGGRKVDRFDFLKPPRPQAERTSPTDRAPQLLHLARFRERFRMNPPASLPLEGEEK